MSYQSGPADDPVDLLDLFAAFVAAAGWTTDDYNADGTGKELHIHKGTSYIHLRSFINENAVLLGGNSGFFGSGIAIVGATGYSAGPNWYENPNAPYLYAQSATVNVMTGVMGLPAGAIQNAWMFADVAGDNVFLVALKQSGIYTYLHFGTMIKPLAYTGGALFGASRSYRQAFSPGNPGVDIESGPPGSLCGFLHAEVDSWTRWENITNQIASLGNETPGKRMQSTTAPMAGGPEVVGDHIYYGAIRGRARSSRTGGIILLPTHWLVERDFGGFLSGGGWSYAGQVPDVFQATITGFVPGATYDISTDSYVLFPQFAIRKYV